jgi:hypothetical protein
MEENQISNRLKKEYKSPIQEILAASSLAYLLSPFRSKRFLIKILWSFFLLIFLFLSIYYVILNIIDYLKYDTISSIQTIYEQESEFPTISICSHLESKLDVKILDFWFNNKEQSFDNDLKAYNDSSFRQCLRFNSDKIIIKHSIKSGFDEGLMLSFYLNTSLDFGDLYISIHNNTKMPETIYNKGYFISSGRSGRKNYFIIKRIKDEKLEQPYNDCYKDVSQSNFNQTIINYLKFKNYDYNQKDCVNLCRNLKYNETNTCGCYLDSLDDEIYMKYISINSSITKCIEKFLTSFNTKIIYECQSNYCPLECDSFEYDVSLYLQPILARGNISNFYNKSIYPEFTDDFKTFEDVSKSFFSINVYYQDLKYTLISQQPKIELFGLISNLGGILGLFIGFSFISLLEIIEVLAELIYIY